MSSITVKGKACGLAVVASLACLYGVAAFAQTVESSKQVGIIQIPASGNGLLVLTNSSSTLTTNCYYGTLFLPPNSPAPWIAMLLAQKESGGTVTITYASNCTVTTVQIP
jgi:hypothetical protein